MRVGLQLCGRERVCGSAVVFSSAAACGSARGIVWWQCALRIHIHKVAIFYIAVPF
jgi:hypothetical protein